MVVRCGVKPVAAVAPRPRPGHHRPKCAVEVPLSCHEDCIHAAAVAYEQFNAHGILWCFVRMHNTCACHVMSSSVLLGLGAIDVIQTRFLIIHSTPVLYAMASAYYYAG